MSEHKLKRKPKELILAKQLIDECKFDEAQQLIENFEENGGHTLYDLVLCHLLRCELLFWRGLYQDVVKLAEQTYKESLGLGKNLLSVDILLIMANALVWLAQSDKLHDIINQGEELLKALTQVLPAEYKQREAYIVFLKGWFYARIRDTDQALKHFKLSISLREELGAKKEIAFSFAAISYIFIDLIGNFDRALNYSERGMTVAEESGNKYCIGYCLINMALGHFFKGDLDRSFKLFERSLTIFNKLNNKNMVAWILNNLADNYRRRGELDRALECIKQAMAINRGLGALRAVASNHDFLLQILIDMGDLERAQQYLLDLEQLNTQLKNKQINLVFLFDKALLLKTSLRAIKRGKAEEIFKQLLEEEDLGYELILKALLSLSELLLIELRITNDLEVLDELNQFIARLLDIAEKSHSYWILCETLLIQAKLSLLTFDIKKAQRFLTQAKQIAERFGLNQLAVKIANENEDLLTKLDLWKILKESGAPMAERLELARLDEKIVGIVYKHTVLSAQLTEEKVAISKETKICLVCRGEVLGFSYICKCGAMYCENCARALTNLENMCWACDVPIDYLKPVKPYKQEEERAKVEDKVKNIKKK